MKTIEDNELEKYGVSINCNIMDNDEKRFRLIGKDGSSYIRTETSENGGWQNSHYHTAIKELYLVQKGSIILIELINDKISIKKYSEGEYCISEPMIPHNIYMFPNTITHTIKFGDCTYKDWHEDNKLDNIIESINVNDI